jgi:RNA polymerase sigma-70 factor (ECF subfamily)
VAALSLVTGSRPAAEDAVQEALARAWERTERGDHIESLKAWVTTVALNLVRSGFRRLRAELKARARLAGASPIASVEDLVDVRRALATLPRRQREATVLRYYLDLSVLEVAQALRINEGTAKTTLHRARQALARALGERADEEATNDAGL